MELQVLGVSHNTRLRSLHIYESFVKTKMDKDIPVECFHVFYSRNIWHNWWSLATLHPCEFCSTQGHQL